MTLDKSFDPRPLEQHWRKVWEESHAYAAGKAVDTAEEDAFCVMIPPPNVTGTLHMGHAFQHTLQDALTRYHRMRGFHTLWQVGTDHAGIATQMVVERNLKQAGEPSRVELGREAFLKKVWDWKAYSGGVITSQIRELGHSVDWQRERFTMDEGYSKAVIEHFVKLYEDGLIYRGKRLVNWDPVLQTSVSDLEVDNVEQDGSLWHIRYPLASGDGHLVVATTRPETLLGDAAVAVHPEDERYRHLIGQAVQLPLCGRSIPIIADDYVDKDFGTGCVKITPAHDFNDYQVGQRHHLPLINVLTRSAHIIEGMPYAGMDRFAARKAIVADLDAQGLLEKIDKHKLKVPKGDRSGAVLEPYLTDQWFVDLTQKGREKITQPALDAVNNGRIQFFPDNWINTYNHWLNNIQDWCISRQLWWGHRIPAWYGDDGSVYVGRDEAEVRHKHGLAADVVLRQDEDVFDTWFSSDLWPMATLGWPENTPEMQRYYPNSTLVTGFDIIFFWVARMVMMGLYFTSEVPFKQVYFTGLVRDPDGKKMSKSIGNVIDPLDVVYGISIEDLVKKRTTGLMQPEAAAKIEAMTRRQFPQGFGETGVDALRFTFAALASNGRDVKFDPKRAEGNRNFCNKIWNAARYVLMQCEGQPCDGDYVLSISDQWIISRLQRLEGHVADSYASYRFDQMAQALYEFIWNDYCDWYLELSKPALQNGSLAEQIGTRRTLLRVLETALRLLHPLMPFITEEIWQKIKGLAGKEGELLMLQAFPIMDESKINVEAEADIAWLQSVMLALRQIRAEMNIAPSKAIPLIVEGQDERLGRFASSIVFLAKIEALDVAASRIPESAVAVVGGLKLHVPLAGLIDVGAEIARLERSLAKLEQGLTGNVAKLDNPQFQKAPEAVQQKTRELIGQQQSEIATLQGQLVKMRGL